MSAWSVCSLLLCLHALPVRANYDEKLAVQDIWLNQATDCKDGLEDWKCGLPCEKTKVENVRIAKFDAAQTMAVVGHYGDDCLLLVRGSKTVQNYLITDVTVVSVKPYSDHGCPSCGVAQGFYAAWVSLSAQIRDHLADLKCSERKLQIVGHSLGAAVGVLAAFELVNKYPISRMYTYGQPRVGNQDFANKLQEKLKNTAYYRIVDYKDPVPRLPLKNMFFQGFVHTGPEAYYHATKQGAYTVCSEPTDQRCSQQYGLFSTVTHGCDHCSYLGLSPCVCGATKGECNEGDSLSNATFFDEVRRVFDTARDAFEAATNSSALFDAGLITV
eukprot:TRINITY_DN9904_c0_g1_i1.p1 TRINITY_DN9904_c0_g1~~TRINITY_DN9904_c0_g1_i1.p1  ORF type:complete len:329 (-),score=63.05 TRINITY_DN9904_c0_g1_i1:206-1192(-)